MLVNCFQLAVLALLAPHAPATAADAQAKTVVRPDAKTGRLVRSVVVLNPRPAEGKATKVGSDILQFIEDTSRANEVDPQLVHSVIQVESNYNPFALSPKGAQGMMQLIPATAQRFGVANSFDARENIAAGVKYLKYLQDMFKDDRLALAAYNAGEGAVIKYKDIPPYPETEQYVSKVAKQYETRRKTGAAKSAASATPPAPQTPPVRSLKTHTDAEGRVYLETR